MYSSHAFSSALTSRVEKARLRPGSAASKAAPGGTGYAVVPPSDAPLSGDRGTLAGAPLDAAPLTSAFSRARRLMRGAAAAGPIEFPEGLDHELTVGGVDAFFWSAARPGELSRFKCELPRADCDGLLPNVVNADVGALGSCDVDFMEPRPPPLKPAEADGSTDREPFLRNSGVVL